MLKINSQRVAYFLTTRYGHPTTGCQKRKRSQGVDHPYGFVIRAITYCRRNQLRGASKPAFARIRYNLSPVLYSVKIKVVYATTGTKSAKSLWFTCSPYSRSLQKRVVKKSQRVTKNCEFVYQRVAEIRYSYWLNNTTTRCEKSQLVVIFYNASPQWPLWLPIRVSTYTVMNQVK